MTDVQVRIDGEEFINGLNLKEKHVYIDFDDVLWELSNWDKQRLYEDLKEEYGDDDEPKTPEEIFASGGSYSEQEFGKVLNQLWEDRWMLTNEQKARIEAITKEKFV